MFLKRLPTDCLRLSPNSNNNYRRLGNFLLCSGVGPPFIVIQGRIVSTTVIAFVIIINIFVMHSNNNTRKSR